MENLVYQMVMMIVAAAVLAAVLYIVYKSWRNGISPMPASAAVRHAVVRVMKQRASRGVMVEAGSGWGTLALQIAESCKGWRVIGIENSVIPMWISFLAARLGNHPNVSFERTDLYTYSYRGVDTVVCYLYPGAMQRLSTIFRAQLDPGAYVISVCFALPDWEPEQTIICRDLYRTKLYVYKA
ncbi:SAM-dependent methyltransferase [Paenibacillus sp. FSL H8-0548]|uniref:class I SAM-dependent methyltransferase n=1 Tax=Paenibacillus sp. FSL H8-0548 TaxID=1920422 RepID=UPI00096D82BD|nr:class I SAM-dependent methyltransferase [Paenibacillus sp. FSL H8-0548]OMF37340.1 SAM-dependent methyltransferase [Paenibacillus sp. FSL H8-0548]